MTRPLVSVICLCYNQARFVRDAITSVLDQTYPNIELIIIDDASTDSSVQAITECIKNNDAIKFKALPQNVGNCRAFNEGLRLSKGLYIIDLAADDILLRHRVEKGVEALQRAGQSYGVNFTDAHLITEEGKYLSTHSDRCPHSTIPVDDVYKDLIARFFICSPTVMFTREVIQRLGGYDEDLAYEDFDFWIRSSRNYFYCYTPEVLVKKRIVSRSLSEKQFSIFSSQQYSTFLVCRKIMLLNRNAAEQKALRGRILYELRMSVRQLNFHISWKYLLLLWENNRRKYS